MDDRGDNESFMRCSVYDHWYYLDLWFFPSKRLSSNGRLDAQRVFAEIFSTRSI